MTLAVSTSSAKPYTTLYNSIMSENETAKSVKPSEGSSNDATGVKATELQTSQVSSECNLESVSTASAPNTFQTSTKESALLDETKNPSPVPREALKEEPANADVPTLPSSVPPKPAVAVAMVTTPVSSAPKIIVSTSAVRSSTPLMVGARVVPAATAPIMTGVQGLGGPTLTPTPVQGAPMPLPRTSTPQQTLGVARAPQTTSLQLPANFHVPQGLCSHHFTRAECTICLLAESLTCLFKCFVWLPF